jgi:histidine ammonia-lyase/phenylalanine ammonia-lyase
MREFAVDSIAMATSIESPAETSTAKNSAVETVTVDGSNLTVEDVARVARGYIPASLSVEQTVQARIVDGCHRLNDLIDSAMPIYGVTTGFGASVRHRIDPNRNRAHLLQERLIEFLGNGTGQTLPVPTARAVMLIRANNLARGYSGVRPELIEMLLKFLNADITPVIPEEGSVGASGDLVPLSYVAAALVGRRTVHFRGQIVAAADALNETGLPPLVLGPKEGLAVVNGTAHMTGIAALACVDARRLAAVADVCTAMAVEVLGGITTPFHQFLHDITKPHPGQARSAANIRGFLADSRMGRPYEEVVAQLISAGETATQDLPQI